MQVLSLKEQVVVTMKRADKGTVVREVLAAVGDAGTVICAAF